MVVCPVSGSSYAVATIPIGTFVIALYVSGKGNTFTFSPVSSNKMVLDPVQHVSACESSSDLVPPWPDRPFGLLLMSIIFA